MQFELILTDMKKSSIFLTAAALLCIVLASFTGCIKTYKMQVSTNNLWFGLEADTQTLELSANCDWTITKNDDADCYSINMESGKNDAIISITVDAMDEGDYRGSSFIINSPNGHVHRTIFVSQNKLDIYGLVNKIFGVSSIEHWNTDYYGQMVEDSYELYEFNPYDTLRGYLMYFFENNRGLQRDHHADTVVYYAFTYEYNPIDQILHIEFETIDDAPESYDPQVLTASDSLYRFMHEWKSNWWERADMRKIGTINPEDKVMLLTKRVSAKHEKGDPIFRF